MARFETSPLQVKVSTAQRQALERAAEERGVPLGTWLRHVALLAANRPDLTETRIDEYTLRLYLVEMADGGSRHLVAANNADEAVALLNFEYAPRRAGRVFDAPTTHEGTPIRRIVLDHPRPHIVASEGWLPFRIGHRVALVQPEVAHRDTRAGRIVEVRARRGQEYGVAFDDGSRRMVPSASLRLVPTHDQEVAEKEQSITDAPKT